MWGWQGAAAALARWRRPLSTTCRSPRHRQRSLPIQRLQLSIHEERVIELGHLPPALSQNRKEPRGKRFVPFHRQGGHVAENKRKLLHADVAGERNSVQARAAHRGIAQQRIQREV